MSNRDNTHEPSSEFSSKADNEQQLRSSRVDEILKNVAEKFSENEDVNSPSTAHNNINKPSVYFWIFGFLALFVVSSIIYVITASSSYEHEDSMAGPSELSASRIREIFNKSYEPAVQAALTYAYDKIDQAYLPVYQSITPYTDFHYSVWGSYVELGSAVLDGPEKVLENKLLSGLDERLSGIPEGLILVFDEQFQEDLNLQLQSFEIDRADLGPLTQIIFNDAVSQTATSSFMFFRRQAFNKVLSNQIIEKVGTKISQKLGVKWLTKAGGAGSSAFLCAWSGPAAPVCAVGVRSVMFFGIDSGMNYIDEFFNREEFESALRAEIDISKKEQKEFFRAEIERMVQLKRQSTDYKLQDFTLKQLSEADQSSICSATKSMVSEYVTLRTDLSSRSDENVVGLLKKAEASAGKNGFFEISKEIVNNLNNFENSISLTPLTLAGRLPTEYVTNRNLSGVIYVNNVVFNLEKSSPTASVVTLSIMKDDRKKEIYLNSKNALHIKGELEQHLYLRNKFFEGRVKMDRSEFIDMSEANQRKIKVPFKLKNTKSHTSSFPLYITFRVDPEQLAPLQMKPECVQ